MALKKEKNSNENSFHMPQLPLDILIVTCKLNLSIVLMQILTGPTSPLLQNKSFDFYNSFMSSPVGYQYSELWYKLSNTMIWMVLNSVLKQHHHLGTCLFVWCNKNKNYKYTKTIGGGG